MNGTRVGTLRCGRSFLLQLSGGVNKVTVTGEATGILLDRIWLQAATAAPTPRWVEAEAATAAGAARSADYSLASGGRAVIGVGGAPGNGNTLTFTVSAERRGTHALVIRYANPEQSPATHYNPDPLARHADLTVNGRPAGRVWLPHSFHANNFWELTVPVQLTPGRNTLRFSAQELPNFDGTTYPSAQHPDLLLRSPYAAVIDKIRVAPFVVE